MDVTLLDAGHLHWGAELERLGVELGGGDNPALFPYHFLYVTLSKIGGKLAVFHRAGQRVGAGFLFPRSLQGDAPNQLRTFTLRFHALAAPAPAPAALCAAVQEVLADAQVVFYDPAGPLTFPATYESIGVVDVGRPDRAEAERLRLIQQEIWGSPAELLYPADIHSAEFGAGTSLVARVDGELAGFLFGFHKFGGSALPSDWETRFRGGLRLESQTLGVLPAYRGLRIANLLKKSQGEQAWRAGIGIVNWTTDPLQYPNAALNFGLLRAVAFDFAPDLYPFRNELNRVHASRFGLTWLVGSRRVQESPRFGAQADVLDLGHRPGVPRVNDGWRAARFDLAEEIIAIEIPADWTGLQRTDLEEATAWRTLTDEIFHRYIGTEPGRYVVTGVGRDQDRRFLVAERAGPELWRRLEAAD